MKFEPSVLNTNSDGRRPILSILEAALEAVDPFTAVQQSLQIEGDTLTAGPHTYDLARFRRLFVLGAGKAGAPMAQATEAVLGNRVHGGLVVVKTGHGGPTQLIEVVEASHPVPDEAGVTAGRRILQMADEATEDDLILVLLSGGGSALLTAPADGTSLADLQKVNELLLASGATIDEINSLRKHLSAVKGGQLARVAAPATLITLALSDVVGNPLDVIASGPTVPDRSTWDDAWSIVERYELEGVLPPTIRERLEKGRTGQIPETPKPDDPAFEQARTHVVADNRRAANAAVERADEEGFNVLLLSTYVEGEAAEVGKVLAALGKEVQASDLPIAAPACLVLGGETTVSLGPAPGKGGRNQEAALSAAMALEGAGGISIVCLATDGTDGPTDSAGGLVDGSTLARGQKLGLSALESLRGHDAYPYLKAVGDLLQTGPTRTNVNDLLLVVVESGPSGAT